MQPKAKPKPKAKAKDEAALAVGVVGEESKPHWTDVAAQAASGGQRHVPQAIGLKIKRLLDCLWEVRTPLLSKTSARQQNAPWVGGRTSTSRHHNTPRGWVAERERTPSDRVAATGAPTSCTN